MGCTKSFILKVQKYPILYDQGHPQHKNIRAKDKVWMEIGEELNENSEELKKKWKNLRDTYAKYIRKTKTKSDDQTANNKKRKWIWANQMEVFRPFLTFDKTISNVSQICSDSATASLDDLKSENNPVELLLESESLDINISQSPNLQLKKERQTKKICEKPSSSAADLMKYIHNKKKRKYDAIDSLMLAHAKTIKTFSERRQIVTKLKIAKVIMEEELLNAEGLSSGSESCSPSPCSSVAHEEPADVKLMNAVVNDKI